MKRATILLVAAIFSATSCLSKEKPSSTIFPDPNDPRPGPSIRQLESPLREIDGCQDLEKVIKKRATDEMEARIRKNLSAALQNNQFSCDRMMEGAGPVMYTASSAPGAGSAAPSAPAGDSATQFSTTNTQETGVDEADFVKNDGSAIYLLSGTKFLIYKAWPPTEAALLSTTAIEGTPDSLYVHQNKALIYSHLATSNPCAGGYAMDMPCSPSATALKLTILDIADKAKPVLLREISMKGSYVNSRRVAGAVHSVVQFPPIVFPGIQLYPDNLPYCQQVPVTEIESRFLALIEKNRKIIEETKLTDLIPSIRDSRPQPLGEPLIANGLLTDCRHFFEPATLGGQSFLTVLSLDMTQVGPLNHVTIIGSQGEVYASPSGLYVAATVNDDGFLIDRMGGWGYGRMESTQIHKFGIDNEQAQATYQASGQVKGRLVNQFAMSEYQGNLRLATTVGHLPDPQTYNAVFVLGQQSEKLETLGMVDQIAKTEDIRSVRFDQDRGFIVTFKKTDPLFALDLYDPKNPRIEGELKIPGFSTYMHLMDRNHLLTVGFDAADQGSFAYFQGIQLQIFDVTDLAAPSLLHKIVIGTRGTSSDATADHMAFNYFAPKKILALPMAICEGGTSSGLFGSQMSFSGLIVWNTSVESGFSERGRVSHPVASSQPQNSCYSWWTSPNSWVKRSIIMDDYVYSISGDRIKINHLDALPNDVMSLTLPR